ncbi:MAG: LamG domain-containing protein, partial [Planctomycetota bacterium]
MCKRLFYSIPFILVLGLFLTSTASAVDPNLVGWWTFDGDFLDSSGNGRNGVLSGTGDFIEGVFGQALDQAGAAYVGITGYKGVLGTNAFSITAWIRTTDAQGVIVGWGGPRGAGDNGTHVEFRTANNGLLRVDHGGGDVRTNNFVNDDQWHHVAVTVAENASVQWPDVKLYIDGVEDGDHTGDSDPFDVVSDHDVTIGREQTRDGRNLVGDIDEVRIYDRELSAEEIEKLSRPPQASKPNPPDDAIYEQRALFLEWTPGFYAAEENGHNLYFGDNFIDVNVGAPDTFKGTMSEESYLIGGLNLGTTYYWRIDEVNETGLWRGDVWDFSIRDEKAWRPSPYVGARYMDPNVTLSWQSGVDAIASYVYFGTDETEVAEGTGDTNKGQQTGTTYTPGNLEFDTVYYWRIDEFKEDATIETGDVWNFQTRPFIPITDPNLIGWWMLDEGAGDIAVDWSGNDGHGTVMGDSQWIDGYDGGALSFDGSGDYVAIDNLYYSDVNLPA